MNKLLIIVDYQNDFVNGALGFEGAEKLDDGILKLAKEYWENGDNIIVTYDTHNKDYLTTQEGKRLPIEHCIEGSTGWELYGKTGECLRLMEKSCEDGGILFVNKTGFGCEKLFELKQALLKYRKIEEVTIVGLVTNLCVLSNAVIVKTILPEARIVIKKDLCGSPYKEMHEKALDIMRGLQMDIE